MDEKEELFSMEEMEDLQKTIDVLKDQQEAMVQSKLPNNVDKYAIDYVKTLDEHDITYLTTKEVFDRYIDFRRKYTRNGEDLLSIRMLNAVIRTYLPKAKISHSNKLRKNNYFWTFDYEE